ncbi:hypothetical protein AXG93_857s1270 [Marchantia polymorpha subsp. ruderalis]|uniref:Uncharacterized protein n=1 Tax=Marchantia polymorpha subsp. ruderalis TaxID=1480154 RepID=A0A176WD21_MARPO|nr:hypothetical protein AXG93_857s1270 [Marchantia polymorpha subsp. ruderalis]
MAAAVRCATPHLPRLLLFSCKTDLSAGYTRWCAEVQQAPALHLHLNSILLFQTVEDVTSSVAAKQSLSRYLWECLDVPLLGGGGKPHLSGQRPRSRSALQSVDGNVVARLGSTTYSSSRQFHHPSQTRKPTPKGFHVLLQGRTELSSSLTTLELESDAIFDIDRQRTRRPFAECRFSTCQDLGEKLDIEIGRDASMLSNLEIYIHHLYSRYFPEPRSADRVSQSRESLTNLGTQPELELELDILIDFSPPMPVRGPCPVLPAARPRSATCRADSGDRAIANRWAAMSPESSQFVLPALAGPKPGRPPDRAM